MLAYGSALRNVLYPTILQDWKNQVRENAGQILWICTWSGLQIGKSAKSIISLPTLPYEQGSAARYFSIVNSGDAVPTSTPAKRSSFFSPKPEAQACLILPVLPARCQLKGIARQRLQRALPPTGKPGNPRSAPWPASWPAPCRWAACRFPFQRCAAGECRSPRQAGPG